MSPGMIHINNLTHVVCLECQTGLDKCALIITHAARSVCQTAVEHPTALSPSPLYASGNKL